MTNGRSERVRRSISKLRLAMGRLNNKRPLLASCLSYATIAGLAELTQQTLQFKLLPVYYHSQAEDFDWPAVGR